jgi:hypothetical protein
MGHNRRYHLSNSNGWEDEAKRSTMPWVILNPQASTVRRYDGATD